jgi:hypothetical protein
LAAGGIGAAHHLPAQRRLKLVTILAAGTLNKDVHQRNPKKGKETPNPFRHFTPTPQALKQVYRGKMERREPILGARWKANGAWNTPTLVLMPVAQGTRR